MEDAPQDQVEEIVVELSKCYYCRIGDCKKCIDKGSRTVPVCGCTQGACHG